MKRHCVAVFAYVAATFMTQAVSHFVINVRHYSSISFFRADPIFALGFLSMLIQGAILSFFYVRFAPAERSALIALKFSWIAGAFLMSYIALAEAAKYTLPSVASWIAVEAIAGFAQFTVFGLFLSLIHGGSGNAAQAA